MKSFNRLREESLEEKLKASDPTGKWISDFVHSDNPKFAGKSKKERIRMALGASYAAKRQNEDNNHIVEATHRIGLTVTDPNHPMVSKRKETIQKTVRMPGEDRENAIKRAIAHYRRKGYKVHDHHYMGTVDEEVELIEKYTENDIANGGTVIYKHEGKHYMSKVSHKTGGGAGTKIHTTSALGHVVPLHNVVSTDASDWNTYKNRPVKEEVEIDEAAWGKDKMANLQAAHDRHSEKAIAANRAGDDAAVKVHQSKMNMIKNQMNKLRKEDVEQVDELRTSTLLRYATKANKALIGGDRSKEEKRIKGIQKANYKIQTRHRVKEEAESTNEGAQPLLRKYVPGYAKRQIDKKMDAGKFGKDDVAKDANFYRYKKIQDKLKKEETEQIDELKRSTLASYAGKSSKEIATAKSYAAKYKKDSEFERDVGHPSRARVLDTQKDVELKHAKKRQAGFDKALGRLAKEEVERIDEIGDTPAGQKALRSYINKADKTPSKHSAWNRSIGILGASARLKTEENLEEGGFDIPEIPRAPTPKPAPKDKNKVVEGSAQDKLYQQHQAIRAANKRPNPEYYKELGMSYDIKDDKERIAKQAEIKKKYKVEGAQLDQLKAMRDDPKWQENPEHKAQLDKRYKMAKDRADLDKGEVVDPSGKPVPVLTPDKFKEKNPNFMKEEGEYPHQGVGVSRSMQMAADIARQKARTSLLQSKYGNEFQDKAMPDYDEDKMDLRPGSAPGTYQATVRMRERMKQESFSSLRNKIAEAKKMKGEDPCWDDYKMIGTKTKNGKEVPNCVPKESVAEGKEEQEYDYEGDMAMSDLRSILHNAKTVHDLLQPNTNIPEWCQSKITLAEDYMSTVANYMRGEMSEEAILEASKPGLYANIHAKRKRIAKGSGERMRKPGTKGAPTAQAFKDAAKTAKK